MQLGCCWLLSHVIMAEPPLCWTHKSLAADGDSPFLVPMSWVRGDDRSDWLNCLYLSSCTI